MKVHTSQQVDIFRIKSASSGSAMFGAVNIWLTGSDHQRSGLVWSSNIGSDRAEAS